MSAYEVPIAGFSVLRDFEMINESFIISNGIFKFSSSATVKYKKSHNTNADTTYYELTGVGNNIIAKQSNISALKLSYSASTGKVSGWFYVYASNEAAVSKEKRPVLKRYKVKVSGYFADGCFHLHYSVKTGNTTFVNVARITNNE